MIEKARPAMSCRPQSLAAFGELELLQLGLPTDEAQKILRIYEEIEERLRLWQEDVLDLGADHCFEVGVRSIAD